MRVVSILLLAGGCSGAKDDPPSPAGPVDEDGDGFTSAEDCDDSDPNARPNAAEVWYDGIDQDCAGDDDYDQDQDGHTAVEFGGDDCVDANASLSPSASEVPYDGLDNDCDPLTPDDDLDGDGFSSQQDCQDEDAQVHPGGLEVVGNALDDDCSGGPDVSPFVMGDLVWSGLSRPHLAQTDDWLVLVVSAQQLSSSTYVPEPVTTVAALLSLDPLGLSAASLAMEPFLWKGAFDDDEVTSVDAGTHAGALTLATAYWSPTNRFGWTMLQPMSWEGPGVGWRQGTASFRATPLVDYDQVDLAFDSSGTAWLCASDEDSVAWMRGDGLLASPGGAASGDGTTGCLAEPEALRLSALSSTGEVQSWLADPTVGDPVVSEAQPYASEHWRAVRERDGIITAVPYDKNGVVYFVDGQRHTALDGHTIEDAEVAFASDGSVWIAAVASAGDVPIVLLAHGEPEGASLTEHWLSPGEDVVPIGASLLVTDERVLVAMTSADRLGWLLLGRPQ